MSYVGCSAIEWSSVTPACLKLQKTSLSLYFPLVRFRNLNIMTFLAAGMPLVSQNSAGAPPLPAVLLESPPEPEVVADAPPVPAVPEVAEVPPESSFALEQAARISSAEAEPARRMGVLRMCSFLVRGSR